MKKCYEKEFNLQSKTLVNMTESLLIKNRIQDKKDEISLIYAGSIYYGRGTI
mgnify:CR=1 FL=1